MQPMRLHWTPRLWGPRAVVVEQLFIFARYSFRTRIIERLVYLIVSK